MTNHKQLDPSNVIPIRVPIAAKRQSERKWGVEVMAQGFCILPALLFRAQKRLGLSAVQLAVVVQLAEFWWDDDKIPWPKKETIGQRLGLGEKQIQRHARALEERGYVQRQRRVTRHGQTSNGYDLSGLVAKLKDLAPEFAEARAAGRKVERRGGLKSKTEVATPAERSEGSGAKRRNRA